MREFTETEKWMGFRIVFLVSVLISLIVANVWFIGKESASRCRRLGFDPWVRKILWRRKWLPTPVFLPGESHEQRSLEGSSPWACKRVGYDWATEHAWYIYIYIYMFNVIYNLKCIFRCKVTFISLKAFQALVKIISLFTFHLFWRPGPSLAKLRTPRTCIWIL